MIMIILMLLVVTSFWTGFYVCRYFWPRIETRTIREISAPEDSIAPLIKSEAIRLVAHVDTNFTGMEGEFKRSQVYRALLNIFPAADKRDLSLAIELAVRK